MLVKARARDERGSALVSVLVMMLVLTLFRTDPGRHRHQHQLHPGRRPERLAGAGRRRRRCRRCPGGVQEGRDLHRDDLLGDRAGLLRDL